MTAAEVLRRARELIADPKRWCQGEWAMDARGRGVNPWGMSACRWCAVGAIDRVRECIATDDEATKRLREVTDLYDIVGWNDSHTHAEVIAAFDRAIAIAEREAT